MGVPRHTLKEGKSKPTVCPEPALCLLLCQALSQLFLSSKVDSVHWSWCWAGPLQTHCCLAMVDATCKACERRHSLNRTRGLLLALLPIGTHQLSSESATALLLCLGSGSSFLQEQLNSVCSLSNTCRISFLSLAQKHQPQPPQTLL